jgi:hypothetical protein
MDIPEGWQLVPKEPTLAMGAAYKLALKEYIERAPEVYRSKRKRRGMRVPEYIKIPNQVAGYAEGIAASEWRGRERGMNIQYIERLSLHEQFRLVEIAHETSNSEIRGAALAVLRHYLNPLVVLAEQETEAA